MLRSHPHLRLVLVSLCLLGPACSSSSSSDPPAVDPNAPFDGADVGPEGGEVVAPAGSEFAGVRLKIPAGALSQKVHVSFQGVIDETPLPETAERVGGAIKLLPEGTTLAAPAELTLPVDREMVGAYVQTSADCKVWARKDAAWERIDAVGHDADTVTIPLSRFTTAAAGVVFSAASTCLKTPALCGAPIPPMTFQSLDQTCQAVAGAPFCLIKLPITEATRGLDELASLNVLGREIYWAAKTDDGVTIARYDLNHPSDPLFKFPAYTGPSTGTIATRGIVAATGPAPAPAWIGLAGVGNLRFAAGQAPVLLDTGSAAGVVAANATTVRRFRRQNVVSSAGLVSKTDVRVYVNESNDSNFSFNYPISPSENVVAFGSFPNGNTPHLFLRSTHRGLAETFLGTALSDFLVFDAQDGVAGVSSDVDPTTFGAAAFRSDFAEAAILKGSRVERRSGAGFRNLIVDYGPPGGVRDVAYDANGRLVAVSSNAELYILQPNGAVQIFPLPTTEVGMVPWRLRNLPGTNDMILVTRGPLTSKGTFYILRFTG